MKTIAVREMDDTRFTLACLHALQRAGVTEQFVTRAGDIRWRLARGAERKWQAVCRKYGITSH